MYTVTSLSAIAALSFQYHKILYEIICRAMHSFDSPMPSKRYMASQCSIWKKWCHRLCSFVTFHIVADKVHVFKQKSNRWSHLTLARFSTVALITNVNCKITENNTNLLLARLNANWAEGHSITQILSFAMLDLTIMAVGKCHLTFLTALIP